MSNNCIQADLFYFFESHWVFHFLYKIVCFWLCFYFFIVSSNSRAVLTNTSCSSLSFFKATITVSSNGSWYFSISLERPSAWLNIFEGTYSIFKLKFSKIVPQHCNLFAVWAGIPFLDSKIEKTKRWSVCNNNHQPWIINLWNS